MLIRDTIAVVSLTTQAEIEAARDNDREPIPEIAFLTSAPTPWEVRDFIYDWMEGKDIDPWDVTVVSCDLDWEPYELLDCGSEEHDLDIDDYYAEHRYCGTTGADRFDYAAEMVTYNEEYLDPDEPDDMAQRIGWVVADLIGTDDSAYPGVDYFNIHAGRFPVWEGSLYGAVLLPA